MGARTAAQERMARVSEPEPFRYRRGYHRPRPALPAPVEFALSGHRFETDGKDLWVTVPGGQRIDRIKVTRFYGSSSMRQGLPRAAAPAGPDDRGGSPVRRRFLARLVPHPGLLTVPAGAPGPVVAPARDGGAAEGLKHLRRRRHLELDLQGYFSIQTSMV